MIQLIEDFENISFDNMIEYYRDELEEIQRTGIYPETMKKHIRVKLRRYGLLDVKKGQNRDYVYITKKTIEKLSKSLLT